MAELTDVERRALIDLANEARRRAYAPYSHLPGRRCAADRFRAHFYRLQH